MNAQQSGDPSNLSLTASILYVSLGTLLMMVSLAMVLNWRDINEKYTVLIGENFLRREYPAKLRRDMWQNRIIFGVLALLATLFVVGGIAGLVHLGRK